MPSINLQPEVKTELVKRLQQYLVDELSYDLGGFDAEATVFTNWNNS